MERRNEFFRRYKLDEFEEFGTNSGKMLFFIKSLCNEKVSEPSNVAVVYSGGRVPPIV